MMYDGSSWTDNSTIPGWYACIAANAGVGCPDLENKFIMGSTAANVGNTGGSNTMLDHTHSCGIQSASHHHSTVIGSHLHNGIQINIQSGTGGASGNQYNIHSIYYSSAAWEVGESWHTLYGDYGSMHPLRTVSTDLGTKTSGNQSASHTHTIGSGSAPGSTDSSPAYYSLIFIRKCA